MDSKNKQHNQSLKIGEIMTPKFDVQSFETKESKSGHHIPVLNGVHLHSAYDPVKEAQAVIHKYQDTLNKTSSVLVLGLGYGYHIDLICKYLAGRWGENKFKIFVIEPIEEVILGCKKINPNIFNSIQIVEDWNLDRVYSQYDFMDFLASKPGVIPHVASFNLNSNYFRDFLSYSSPTTREKMMEFLTEENLVNYFKSFKDQYDYNEMIDEITIGRQEIRNNLDYLLLAFNNISKIKKQDGASI